MRFGRRNHATGFHLSIMQNLTLQKVVSLAPENLIPLTTSDAVLLRGDSFELMDRFIENGVSIPLIFSDPPYFLSNGGISCSSGKMVLVDKGVWDKSASFQDVCNFHRSWISRCLKLLSDNGTIWIRATQHSVFVIGYILQELGCTIINVVTWEKPNPPPNLSCRYFTHSTETLIWAKKNKKSKHCFNYAAMREMNDGKQMKTVWRIAAPSKSEKEFGHHPTQKPLALLQRIILAASRPGDVVLDPFAGSSTTGVAALGLKRLFIGVEKEADFVDLAQKRLLAKLEGQKSL